MKKLYQLLLLIFLIPPGVHAQTAGAYIFSTKTGIALESMTSGATSVIPANFDEVSSPTIAFPFTFNFAGVQYTNFTFSDNGILALGSSPVSFGSSNSNFGSSTATIPADVFPILMPWTDDLSTATNGGVSYKTVGTTGSRKLVIEWRVIDYYLNTNAYSKRFQLWLFEGSNTVQFVYGTGDTDIFNNTIIGISQSATDYIAINTNSGTGVASRTSANINQSWPGSGVSYIFTPNTTTSTTTPITVSTNNTITNITCNGAKTGAITLGTISGGDGNYTVNWTSANYTGTGTAISALAAGTYHYIVTDRSSGSASGDLIITQPTAITPTVSSITNASCTNAASGSFTIAASGGVSPYTYTANSVTNTTGTFSNLAAGTYTVTVKDANNCSINTTVTIGGATPAVITASGVTSICQGTSVTLTASTGTSYLWSNGATTASITASTTANYTVKVTSGNGCSSTSAPVSVTVNALPVATITAGSDNNFLCSGLTLTASSNTTAAAYTWSNAATTSVINLTNSTADGSYTVKIKDNNGCTSASSSAYVFNKQNLLDSYTMIGLTSISLGTSTNIAKGSIGVTGSTGTISFGKSSVAAPAFVKAKSVTTTTGYTAPNIILAPATVTLPVMQNNTAVATSYPIYTATGTGLVLNSNYSALTVKAGSNVTLGGTIYGTITIEDGSTVAFSGTNVSIDKLIVGTTKTSATSALSTLRFVQNSALKISTSVTIYGRSRVNAEDNNVTFYCGDGKTDAETFAISGVDNKLNGTIYIPIGTLSVSSSDASTTTTTLTGLFIADKITSSGAYAVWQKRACTTTTVAGVNSSIQQEELLQNVSSQPKLTIYPNPANGLVNLRLSQVVPSQATIVITDANGRNVMLKSWKLVSGNQSIQLDLAKEPAGVYLIKVVTDNGVASEKVIIRR